MTDRKKNRTKRAGLETRARAIVADVRAYDYDTRRALAWAIKDASDEDLSRMLAEAEAGEIVEHPLYEVSEDYHSIAHAVLRLMESNLPDFLLDGMMAAINAAARRFGLEVWKQFPAELEPSEDYDGQGYSSRELAELFRVGDTYSADLVPRPTLAEHIAAVFAHDDTPTSIYNALGDAVTDLTARDEVTNSPEVIGLALKLYAERKGGKDA
jgi:hypothetical protein